MPIIKQTTLGWVQALIAVLIFFGLNNVMIRYAAFVLEVNPIIYSSVAFCSCALILLAIVGPGKLAKETMRSLDTWIYGLVLILGYITGLVLFSYVSSTEGTMLQKFSSIIAILGAWLFLGRTPDKYQFISIILMAVGVGIVFFDLNTTEQGIIIITMILFGVFQSARIFVAELHRPHAQAAQQTSDPKAKTRVIGFVMFLVSVFFLILSLLLAYANSLQETPISGLPQFVDFTHGPTIFAGFFAGIVLVAPLRLLEFASTYRIKGENYATIASLSFVSTLFWEWATSPITGLSMKEVSQQDLFAGLLITIGGLLIALTRGLKKTPKWEKSLVYATQDPEQVDDSREIIANTLEHFNGDIKKTEKSLELEKGVITAILEDSEKVLAFNSNLLKKVARNYRRKVAMSDALTGLANRAGFMTVLKGAAYEADIYSLLFIDLNKFKPVNDTYGHDAGDAILKGVAERLSILFPKRACVTRLGGDEFAVLLLDSNKEQAETFVSNIKEILSEPFDFKGTEIIIGASVGIATYPYDGTDPEKLLKQADEGMYREKSER